MTDEFSELAGMIGTFYDAVIEPDLWQKALDDMRSHFGFHLGALSVIALPTGTGVVQVTTNIPDGYLAGMSAYNDDVIQLWGGLARMAEFPLEEPVLQSTVTGPEIWNGNRFYEEWVRPLGLVDQIGIILARDRTMVGNLGLGRHESAPPLTEREMEGLRLLAPHLRRAVTISRILDVATSAATTFEAALDATRSAVVLVAQDMAIVHANSAARAMLANGDPISSVRGKLTLARELVPNRLQAAVQAAAHAEQELGRRGIGIAAKSRDGTALAVQVMPLENRSLRGGLDRRAAVAVFIGDAAAPLEMPADAMRLLYELTPAEQRVFELVVAGEKTADIARTLGVAPSTVRSHLLKVFEKTGRHTRGDLVKLSREITLPG
ncbi:MAG: helix-turn-helix transcriptional regulator [Mesorhizobium sp.]|uniref:helix-turn-helix transcriptional regulator n=1 Tax=Mesorhizobium sp. TaxID=1871066 RepID=UPI001AC23108|nr:helix-turn-helix transcriptional regulator [Mesorhizobium sp.]MBN9217680.1 helix-turn-helix transcriptional regulator [Mesorhizobium sp.]